MSVAMPATTAQQSTERGLEEIMAPATAMVRETGTATEMVTATAMITKLTLRPTTAHHQQPQGQHAGDVPCGNVGGNDVGGGGGGAQRYRRGGGNGRSGRVGQWLGRAAAVLFFFRSDFFLTLTATATECQCNGVVSSHKAHPRHVVLVAFLDAPS
jgi:hypothetical protein